MFSGVHTFQRMYGCEFDDQTEETKGFLQDGYDGEDFLILDLKEMRYISPVQQGALTVEKLNKDRAKLDYYRNYFSTVCIESLKKYVQYGKSSLQRTGTSDLIQHIILCTRSLFHTFIFFRVDCFILIITGIVVFVCGNQ